mgnify:CR=1 FL=1
MVTLEEKKFMENNLKQVAIITGANSMIGKALVLKFANENWKIHATVRSKSNKDLIQGQNIVYHEMDLENQKSIHKTVDAILKSESKIDALINNAGFVLSGPFECLSDEQIRRQMEVNFFGTVFMIKALLPKLKTQKNSAIINMSSLCGLVTFPMLSMYHASKWALEGFSESLMFELESFEIRVKLIEPGGVKENDYASNVEFASTEKPEYKALLDKVHKTNWFPSFSEPNYIAQEVYNAALDKTSKLRYKIGTDCMLFLEERNVGFKDESYLKSIKKRISGEI